MVEPSQTIFEIAAGVGMLGRGVQIALDTLGIGSDVVGGCEWETCAAAAFVEAVETETGRRPAVWDDATTFAPRRWRSRTGSVVDIITAGYPCQPFSTAGRRTGAKDDRHLWPACRRIIARLKPSVVYLENVDGHVSLGLWKVLRDCERLGYRVACGVFSSEEVGAPHLRKRVFVLGVANAGRGGIREASSGPAGGADGTDARRAGSGVADADEPRRQGRLQRRGVDAGRRQEPRERRAASDCVPVPLFPPGRNDYERWAELAAGGLDPTLMPAIESGVSVVADGLASSSDLLRLGGNGVNPVCAAWAFLNLYACLMDDLANASGGPRPGDGGSPSLERVPDADSDQ